MMDPQSPAACLEAKAACSPYQHQVGPRHGVDVKVGFTDGVRVGYSEILYLNHQVAATKLSMADRAITSQ